MALVSDVRDRIKSDLPIVGSTTYDTQIEDAIRSALRQLRTRKFWFLETSANISLSSGASSVALPTNFAAPGTFDLSDGTNRFTHGNGFDFISYEDLRSRYWTKATLPTEKPVACAISNGTLYFSSLADQAYTIPAVYYKKDVTLPTSGETSVWFDDGYDAVRAMAMYIFKRESKQFTASEDDGSMMAFYLEALSRQHERYEGSR